ncbi:hypothetical protein SAMN05444362_1052 [Dysgonomonas macrotermitis]|uniref:Uncharacterized protein n=1 Tax=Dysgonomonas macrotermitis TaxID=1346286 RepID=A0A1M5ABT3_9BACT|nr:hypothetical protein SAMN05444362_1052 [Dysgonomonas macrotermitis]
MQKHQNSGNFDNSGYHFDKQKLPDKFLSGSFCL